jgi:hypothetical protein
MDGYSNNNILFTCCFCNKTTKSSNLNPTELNILINWDKEKSDQKNQSFWCHYECLNDKLHENIRQHLVLHLLVNE